MYKGQIKIIKTILFSTALLFSSLSVVAQAPNIQWQLCVGGTGGESLVGTYLKPDNSFFLTGATSSVNGNVSGNHGGSDAWMVDIDGQGNLVWQKCLGGTGNEKLFSPLLLSDSNYLLVGVTTSNDGDVTGNHGDQDGWLVKTDSLGTMLWQKCIGGTNNDGLYSLIKTRDNGFILCGNTASNDFDVSGNHGGNGCGAPCQDAWVVKLDSVFNILWSRCYGGTHGDAFTKIIQTPDGGYIAAGSTESDDGDINNHFDFADYWLVKLDSMGNIEWNRDYGGSDMDILEGGFCLANNGGYILPGYTNSNDGEVSGNHSGLGFMDYWILNVDSTGNVLWEKCFGGQYDEFAYSDISQTNDGGYVVTGSANSFDGNVQGIHNPGFYVDDTWVIKIDSSGNLEWQKCLGGSDGEVGYGIKQTNDSGYLVLSFGWSYDGDMTGSGNHGAGDVWIVKLSPQNVDISNSSVRQSEFELVYQRETSSILLGYFASGNEKLQATLFDITGRNMLTQLLKLTNGFNKKEILTPSLNPGIYLVRLETESGSVTRKVVVE